MANVFLNKVLLSFGLKKKPGERLVMEEKIPQTASLSKENILEESDSRRAPYLEDQAQRDDSSSLNQKDFMDVQEEEQLVPYIEPTGSTQEEIKTHLKDNPGSITFIHGKAGCDKTHLLKQLENEIPDCQILAPTNIVRSMYSRASTLHSFFYGAFDDLDEGYQNPDNLTEQKISRIASKVRCVGMLIIDEISN